MVGRKPNRGAALAADVLSAILSSSKSRIARHYTREIHKWGQINLFRPAENLDLTLFSAGEDFDVLQDRILGYRDLVLDEQPAARAAELAELRHRIDEAAGVADDRVGSLDRQVVAHAVGLVVVADGAEVLAAFGAAVVLVVVDRDVLGGEDLHLARKLADRLLGGLSLHAPRAQLLASALGAFRIAEHDAVDVARRDRRDVAVVDVGFDLRQVALERVAEAAGRGPQDGVYVRRTLREVLLA